MDVVHALWDTENIHLWAESSKKYHKLDHEESPLSNELSHPYTITFTDLNRILKKIKTKNERDSYKPNWVAMGLPSMNGKPQPSPYILMDKSPVNNSELFTNFWQINTIEIPTENIVDFLINLEKEPPENITYSDSILFWQHVTKFALKLIQKGSYLPYITVLNQSNENTEFIGTWKAIILGKDKLYLDKFIKAIPPYCLNINNKTNSPTKLIYSFIHRIVDSYLKSKINVYIPPSRLPAVDIKDGLAKTWFESLYDSANRSYVVKTNEFNYFFGILKSWLREFQQYGYYTKFNTCFKLTPPTESYEQWNLEIFLQNEMDENLIIPAKKIWNYEPGTIEFLEQRFENPQERLLKDLANAEKIYPKISDCLNDTFPKDLHLTMREALVFITQYAENLEKKGYKVYLPKWWNDPTEEVKIELESLEDESVSANNYSLFSLNRLINFDWRISIGDMKISKEEFEQLASLKIPFVNIRGQWIKLDLSQIDDVAHLLKEKYSKINMKDLIEIEAMLSDEGFDSLITNLPTDTTFMRNFNQFIKKSNFELHNQPANFQGVLRPYQLTGYSWLLFLRQLGYGACLADDMGLGKTIQIIAMLQKIKEEKPQEFLSTLLICPMSIIGNWYKELQKFAPNLKVYIYHGSDRAQGQEFLAKTKNYDVIITTYSLVQRDFQLLSTINWVNVIIDEAQNIKNPSSKQSRAIRKLSCDFRIALTGTPIENRLMELWSIMDFLNPGYLGSKTQFYSEFIEPIEKKGNEHKIKLLANVIQPFILRRLKTDPMIVKDLPEKNESKVYCSLTEEQALLYESVVRNIIEKLDVVDGIERKGLILSALTKLKQICNHPAHFLHDYSKPFDERSGKITRLLEMLKEVIENNDKALLFTQYTEFGAELKKFLEQKFKTSVLFLHGGIRQKERDKLVQEFQNTTAESPKLFILSIKAGGVGLNLTAGNHVFHIDRWWNPSVENQATDRAFRIGQTKNVFVYKFISIGTLEENLDKLIERKLELAESIVGTGDSWITELSTEQLRNLFSLKSITTGE